MLLLYYNILVICMYNTCILVLSHYTVRGGGRIHIFTGCIQSTPTMVNTLSMKDLLFANVSEMLENNIGI